MRGEAGEAEEAIEAREVGEAGEAREDKGIYFFSESVIRQSVNLVVLCFFS